jgi:hypothetical protein
MHFHETRVAIAAGLAGLVLASGIGVAAAPATPPPPVAPATATPLVDASATGIALNQIVSAADDR